MANGFIWKRAAEFLSPSPRMVPTRTASPRWERILPWSNPWQWAQCSASWSGSVADRRSTPRQSLVDGHAVAFCGVTGAGKSTTAAQFVRLGHPLITDDVMAWKWDGDACLVQTGPTRVKLWPDSAAVVQPEEVAGLPRVHAQVEKRILNLPTDAALSTSGHPLSCIHLLTPGAERACDLSPAEAFVALKEHCRDDSILPRELRARQFEELARLVRTVRVRRVPAHTGLDRLESFARSLLKGLRASPR